MFYAIKADKVIRVSSFVDHPGRSGGVGHVDGGTYKPEELTPEAVAREVVSALDEILRT